MGGGEAGQQNMTVEELLKQQQRREVANKIAGDFQSIGAKLAQPTASTQPLNQGGGFNPSALPGMSVPQPLAQTIAGIGPLFGGAGGGVNEQQLARILASLGYG